MKTWSVQRVAVTGPALSFATVQVSEAFCDRITKSCQTGTLVDASPTFSAVSVIRTDWLEKVPLDRGRVDVTMRSESEAVVSLAVFGPSSTAPMTLVSAM